jgi:hypothetical protein
MSHEAVEDKKSDTLTAIKAFVCRGGGVLAVRNSHAKSRWMLCGNFGTPRNDKAAIDKTKVFTKRESDTVGATLSCTGAVAEVPCDRTATS